MTINIVAGRAGNGRFNVLIDKANKEIFEGKKVLFLALDLRKEEIFRTFYADPSMSVMDMPFRKTTIDDVKKMQYHENADVVFIDSLHFLLFERGGTPYFNNNQDEIIKKTYSDLERWSQEKDVTLFIGRQLMSEVNNIRPTLNDLTEPEQNADSVLGVHFEGPTENHSNELPYTDVINLKNNKCYEHPLKIK